MDGLILLISRFYEFRLAKLLIPIIRTAPSGNSIMSCPVPAPPGTKKEGLRSCLATLSFWPGEAHQLFNDGSEDLMICVVADIQLEIQAIILIAKNGLFDHRNGGLFARNQWITSMVKNDARPR